MTEIHLKTPRHDRHIVLLSLASRRQVPPVFPAPLLQGAALLMPRQAARMALRAATGSDHEAVDAVFSQFDLSNRGDYGAFLLAQAGAFLPTERALDDAGIADFVPDWPERQRSNALIADIHELGLTTGALPPPPVLKGVEETLGALYVIEGSRLGGSVLVRKVPAGFPRRFLQANDKTLWSRLIEIMDNTLISTQQQETAARAARDIFARFEAAARLQLRDA